MADFLSAALPLVLMGVAIAVIAAHFGMKKKKLKMSKSDNVGKTKIDDADQEDDTYMTMGMSMGMPIGMCFGTVLGSLEIISLSYGISFGMLLGMVVGMLVGMSIKKK